MGQELPRTYAEALEVFEMHKESFNPEMHGYYKALFEHELKEFEDYFSSWEGNRIY